MARDLSGADYDTVFVRESRLLINHRILSSARDRRFSVARGSLDAAVLREANKHSARRKNEYYFATIAYL
jgi:hypothetical protein